MSPVSTPLSLLPGEPSTTFKQTEIYVFNKIRLVDLSFLQVIVSQKVHTFLTYVKTRVHTHNKIFDILTAEYGVNSNVREQHIVFYHEYMHTYNSRHLFPCLSRHFPSSLEKFGAKFSHLQQA